MRPRPEGRGDLQCAGTALTCSSGLKWGHGPKAVETVRREVQGLVSHDASMGPRPEGRGDANPAISSSTRVCTLQWGHGPKAVETRTPSGIT